MNGKNDEDWFKVVLNKAQSIKVNISGGISGGDHLEYYLYEEKELKESSNPKHLDFANFMGSGGSAYYKVKSGTYYIRIKPMSHTTGWAEKDFKLVVDLLEEDAYENNDTWNLAREISLGNEYNITLNAENDYDWFKVTLLENQNINIKLNSQNSKSINYYIYNSENVSQTDAKPVYQGDIYTNNEKSFSLDKGQYYIKLTHRSGNYEENIKFRMYTSGDEISRPTVKGLSSNSNFDVYKNIEFEFSMPMNASTLTKENITLKNYNDSVDFDIEYIESQNRLVLIPTDRLNYSNEYSVNISSNVKSLENNMTMASNYNWKFTTRANKTGIINGEVVVVVENLKRLVKSSEVKVYQGDKVIKTVGVDNYGKFTITNLSPGDYTLRANLPGFLDDAKKITLTSKNEAIVQLNPIYGDSNNDGIIDIYDLSDIATNYNKISK